MLPASIAHSRMNSLFSSGQEITVMFMNLRHVCIPMEMYKHLEYSLGLSIIPRVQFRMSKYHDDRLKNNFDGNNAQNSGQHRQYTNGERIRERKENSPRKKENTNISKKGKRQRNLIMAAIFETHNLFYPKLWLSSVDGTFMFQLAFAVC